MKKTILLALTCAATITLTSCNQDRDESFAETKVNTISSRQMTARSSVDHMIPDYVKNYYTTVKWNNAFDWDYTEDGCYARAHKMGQILQNYSNVKKIFVYGTLANNWRYHVAILIDGLYVIDPALDKEGPLTKSEWIGKCTYNYAVTYTEEIRDLHFYSPNYNESGYRSGYTQDDYYIDTNKVLNEIQAKMGARKGAEIARSFFGKNSARR